MTSAGPTRRRRIDDVYSNSAWNENHDYTYDDTVQNDEAYIYDKNGNRTGNRTGNQTHLGTTTRAIASK